MQLQFQASEGLGSLCIQTNYPKDAIHHLKQALKTLDEIKQDTGMARERVMEKLSDATEALQKGNSNHPRSTTISSEDESSEGDLPGLHESSGKHHPTLPDPSSEEQPSVLPDSSLLQSGENNVSTSLSGKSLEIVSSLPLPAKKATASLPPIRSPKLTLTPAKGVDGSATEGPSAVGKVPLHKKSTRRRRNVLGIVNEIPDTYEQQLNAYVDSIKHDASPASSSDTNLSSGEEHSDHLLGASVFSRHASKGYSRSQKSPLSVGEGSLAIGPNARELYTTGTTVVEKEHGKGGKPRIQVKTEIVPVGKEPCTQTTQAEGRGQSQQSKVCLIL